MTEFLDALSELLAAILALAGCAFLALAALALHRMPDVYGRLSATSKAVSLGATLLLAAAAVHSRDPGITARVAAGMAFLLLTSPIAGHVLGRAAWRSGEEARVAYRDPFPTRPETDERVVLNTARYAGAPASDGGHEDDQDADSDR